MMEEAVPNQNIIVSKFRVREWLVGEGDVRTIFTFDYGSKIVTKFFRQFAFLKFLFAYSTGGFQIADVAVILFRKRPREM